MLPWRRHRKASARLEPRVLADSWQLCSLLLDYPGAELPERLSVLRRAAEALPEQVRGPLTAFLDHAAGTDLGRLQRDYVETFDVTRKCALHLTYFLHGDTRNRGVALVTLKQTYRRAGGELADEDAELPDYLPLVLEFGATVDPDAAWKILNDHRVGIELLRRALESRTSPWLDVVQALRATLPPLEDDDEVALARLIAEGPPQEEVGIDTAPYLLPTAADQTHPAMPHTPQPQPLGTTIPVGAPR